MNGTPEGEATTFSIKIASSDAATKAIATNYKYATDDEINVNNVMVAVFKANGTSVGDLVSGPTTVSSSNLTLTTSSDGKKAYEITNLVGKTGSAYILVIANSSADYSAWRNYTISYYNADKTIDSTFNTDYNSNYSFTLSNVDVLTNLTYYFKGRNTWQQFSYYIILHQKVRKMERKIRSL